MNFKHPFLILSLIFFTLSACDTTNYSAYEAWDLDGDGSIDAVEYNNVASDAGYFRTWDTNQDQMLDENEWQTGVTENYPEFDYDTYGYTIWDVNQDQQINEEEFTTTSYRVMDTDNDGKVEVEEFQAWNYE